MTVQPFADTTAWKRPSDLKTAVFAGGNALDASLSSMHPPNDPFNSFQYPGTASLSLPHNSEIGSPLPYVNSEAKSRAAAARRIATYRDAHPSPQHLAERHPAISLHHIDMLNSNRLIHPELGRPLPFVPVRYRARD